MKLQHLEYVIAIAQEGSITGAAKKLYQAQPNISIALKELESKIGIQIFWRTQNGMLLTPEGEYFFMRAKKIVAEMHALESEYSNRPDNRVVFKVAATRSSYVTAAIGQWINKLNSESRTYSFHFLETNTHKVIEEVGSGKADLGVIRVASNQTELYRNQLEQKKLEETLLTEFPMKILMSSSHPLAVYDDIPFELIRDYTEIIHGDEDLNIFRKTFINPDFDTEYPTKQVYVYDRGSKMSFLETIKNSYMWVSPVPKQAFSDGKMTVRKCSYACVPNRDIIIYKKNTPSGLIKSCISYLVQYAKEVLTD